MPPSTPHIITLPYPYELLAFYKRDERRTAIFVKVLDGGPAMYATYTLANAEQGRYELGHYFGADELAEAQEDFRERSGMQTLDTASEAELAAAFLRRLQVPADAREPMLLHDALILIADAIDDANPTSRVIGAEKISESLTRIAKSITAARPIQGT